MLQTVLQEIEALGRLERQLMHARRIAQLRHKIDCVFRVHPYAALLVTCGRPAFWSFEIRARLDYVPHRIVFDCVESDLSESPRPEPPHVTIYGTAEALLERILHRAVRRGIPPIY